MAKRIHVPTTGLSDWRRLLAEPDKHWVRSRSAFETAVSWEATERTPRGLPPAVAAALDGAPELASAELLLALPEHKVPMPGRGRPSQNDVWTLLRGPLGQVSMAVEGKAGEPFDRPVSDWLRDASEGKRERIAGLCELLGRTEASRELGYHLFHRTASAILEARRFGAPEAVMLVQSFLDSPLAWADFVAFGRWLGCDPGRGSVTRLPGLSAPRVWIAWVDCAPASDATIAAIAE